MFAGHSHEELIGQYDAGGQWLLETSTTDGRNTFRVSCRLMDSPSKRVVECVNGTVNVWLSQEAVRESIPL